jgi:hypothetical protein
MSGIQGYANQLFFGIRSTANINSPGNQFSFVKVASFELLDESNVNIVGFTPITESDMILQYAHQYDKLFKNNTNSHVWSFSQTPVADLKYGSCNGGHFFNGFNSIKFTTKSTLVGGSYQLVVIALCSENLRINKAHVTFTRS